MELLLSVPLVLQYEEVLFRAEHLAALNVSTSQVELVLDALCRVGKPTEISYLWRPTLRDPGDEMVLELAVQGRADRLITFNERDFAGAERFGIPVLRPGPAWQAWKGDGS